MPPPITTPEYPPAPEADLEPTVPLDVTVPGPRPELVPEPDPQPDPEPAPPPSAQTAPAPEPAPAIDEVSVGGDTWLRIPVRTALVEPGQPVGASLAWYASEHRDPTTMLTSRRIDTSLEFDPAKPDDLWHDPSFADALAGPWFLVLSGKAVAVSQRRVTPIDSVTPGRAARTLSRWARRRQSHLGEPRSMQVAINHNGLIGMTASVLLGRNLGLDIDLYPPRRGAAPPADAAVIRAPYKPDTIAAALVNATRAALPREVSATLAGVAIVSADGLGCRVLGYADGPFAATPRPRTLLGLILADNPAGQDTQRTPVVLVMRAPHNAPTRRGRDYYANLDANRLTATAGA